jgi:hypothetical protein
VIYWFAFGFVVLACLAERRRKRRLLDAGPKYGVSFDDVGVRRRYGRIDEEVRWADVEQITIVTTDEGPMREDWFWLFVDANGCGCAVPGGAVGDEVFAHLKTLQGVDYGAIASAAGSTDNASFPVWTRGAAPATREG